MFDHAAAKTAEENKLKAEYQAWRNGSEFAKSLIFIQGVGKSIDCHLKAVANKITKYLCNL